MSAVLTETDRLPWFSDAHIKQFTDDSEFAEFSDRLRAACSEFPYAPLASAGDLGWQGQGAEPYKILDLTLEGLPNSVLAIRGNHDLSPRDVAASNAYFESSDRFADVNGKIIHLNARTCLIGENGAPDFRSNGRLIKKNANFRNTKELSFPELYGQSPEEWPTAYGAGRLLREQADRATRRILNNLTHAFKQYECAVLLTHYPPFRQAAYHNDEMGTPAQCPAIINKRLGEELVKVMQEKAYQEKQLIVLCGHTHEAHTYYALNNLVVHVGEGNRSSDESRRSIPSVQTLILPS